MDSRGKEARKRAPARRGHRRTSEQIRRLILKLARANEWGYTRILGEFKKLGIQSVSKNTVKRILKDAGLDSGGISEKSVRDSGWTAISGQCIARTEYLGPRATAH